jgi:hypothetical protein
VGFMSPDGADLRDLMPPPKDPVQITSPAKAFYDPTLDEDELWAPIAAGQQLPVPFLCKMCKNEPARFINEYFFCRHWGPCQKCYDKLGLHKEAGLGRCPRCSKIVTKWVVKER